METAKRSASQVAAQATVPEDDPSSTSNQSIDASSGDTGEVIPILRVSSAAASFEQLYSKLGFKREWEHRFEPHLPAFVEISNGNMRLFLSEHTGDATPNTLVFFRVPDVDAFVAGLEGVEVVDVPEIGMRDCEVTDLDGNRIRIGTRLKERS